jgi:hypothetical protein
MVNLSLCLSITRWRWTLCLTNHRKKNTTLNELPQLVVPSSMGSLKFQLVVVNNLQIPQNFTVWFPIYHGFTRAVRTADICSPDRAWYLFLRALFICLYMCYFIIHLYLFIYLFNLNNKSSRYPEIWPIYRHFLWSRVNAIFPLFH